MASATSKQGGSGRAPRYSFNKLQRQDSIRILHLQPAHADAPVQASLLERQLDDQPEYEALSYTWGDPVYSEAVVIDGLAFNVTSNLHSALLQLRHETHDRLLWIDAICINQEDDKEKGSQVGLMNRIFSEAQHVLIWLGPGDKMAHMAMQHVDKIITQAAEDGIDIPNPNMWELRDDPLRGSHEHIRRIINNAEGLHLYDIYRQPWFTRLWIVQEVVLSKLATVICGPFAVSWNLLAKAILLYLKATRTLHVVPKHDRLLYSAYSIITAKAFHGVTTGAFFFMHPFAGFGNLVAMLARQQCTDDRDRVYASLGLRVRVLQTFAIHGALEPDYSLTVEQTYKNFSKPYFVPNWIGVLDHVGLWCQLHPCVPESVDRLSHRDYMPSWSFDLRPKPAPYATVWKDNTFETNNSIPSLGFNPSVLDGSALGVKAMPWDAIERVFDRPLGIRSRFMETRDFVLFLRDFFYNKVQSPIEEPKERILARTLAVDGAEQYFEDDFGTKVQPADLLELWRLYEKLCLDEQGEVYQVYRESMCVGEHLLLPDFNQRLESLSRDGKRAWLYSQCIQTTLFNSCVFLTADGYLGHAPARCLDFLKRGAWVYIVAGGRTPYLLLPWMSGLAAGVGYHFSLIGPAYVHGIMYGQVGRIPGASRRWMTAHIV